MCCLTMFSKQHQTRIPDPAMFVQEDQNIIEGTKTFLWNLKLITMYIKVSVHYSRDSYSLLYPNTVWTQDLEGD